MKKLVFPQGTLGKDSKFGLNLDHLISQIPELNTFFVFKDISIETSIFQETTIDAEFQKNTANVQNFSLFLLIYVWNILSNNEAAEIRQEPPYDLLIKSKICFNTKQFQFYLYIDDSIFGLVVGSKFKNVTNLIQTLFPISAKMDFSNEIRFFPISRDGFNTEVVKA